MPRRLIRALAACILLPGGVQAAWARTGGHDLLVAPHRAAVKPSRFDGWSSGRIVVRPDPHGPDESALRYYASHNETQRVAVEIARLRRLYPNWRPPKNLYSSVSSSSGDETELWALFGADKLNELRQAIAKRERDEPGWRPSADLARKMRAKQTRFDILSLWKKGRWRSLIKFTKTSAFDIKQADTETLWTIAAAYAKAKENKDALAIYQRVFAVDNVEHERLATFEKAMANLPMNDVEALLSQARKEADGSPEYEPILIDIIRARIVAYLHQQRAAPVPQDQLQKFETYARSSGRPDQQGLIAWYLFNLKDDADALDWFTRAIAHGGDAMIAHGLANALAALGYDRDAEDVAYAWRKPLVNNDIFFIDLVGKSLTKPAPGSVSPQRLANYAKVVMDSQSGEGAQALAWYAYNSCQFKIARQWFRRAVAWRPMQSSVRGYALALQKLRNTKEFYQLLNRYDGLFPKLLELIFPDGARHPPTLCEQRPPGVRHGQAQRFARFIVPGPAELTAAGARASIAPDSRADMRVRPGNARLPRFDHALFPASVDPQNPLRSPARQSDWEATLSLVYRAEPSPGPWPLIARRVPGVGPMPYERYGFSLLPAWNGVDQPTWPPYAETKPARGTLAAGGAPPRAASSDAEPAQADREPASPPEPAPPEPAPAPVLSSEASAPNLPAQATRPGDDLLLAPAPTMASAPNTALAPDAANARNGAAPPREDRARAPRLSPAAATFKNPPDPPQAPARAPASDPLPVDSIGPPRKEAPPPILASPDAPPSFMLFWELRRLVDEKAALRVRAGAAGDFDASDEADRKSIADRRIARRELR